MIEVESRFWEKANLQPDPPDGCGEWLAGKYASGYGAFSLDGRSEYAHRVAFALTHGREVAEGNFVCHTCDNRGCVRPSHLFEGTPLDDVRDMDAKGRRVSIPVDNSGERSGHARLTWAVVIDARRRYAEGGVSQQALADSYGVSQGTLSRALRGETWRNQ